LKGVRHVVLLLLAAAALSQDLGGRDRGEGRPVVFVRWERSAESGEIYRTAWAALEPYFGILSRRRLADFDRSEVKAKAFFAAHSDISLVVAFDRESARFAPKGVPVLQVGPASDDHVITFTARDAFARELRLFAPDAKRVALFGPRKETLRGFTVVHCKRPEDAAGCDLVWIAEGGSTRTPKGMLVVTTSDRVPDAHAALTVRPDPSGLGLQVAAAVLAHIRAGKPFGHARIRRHRVTVDLRATLDHDVPLAILARADAVRRRR